MKRYELVGGNGHILATSTFEPGTLLDAAVLRHVFCGKGSIVRYAILNDGEAPFYKARYGVDEDGTVWSIDGSGVPATIAGSPALYIDGLYRHAQSDYAAGRGSRHSKKV